MNLNRLTTKSAESLQGSMELASSLKNSEITALHLALVLVKQPGGIVSSILQKLQKNPEAIASSLQTALTKLPTISGPTQPVLSAGLRETLEKAEQSADQMGDEYVSTEHLLIGLLSRTEVQTILDTSEKE